MLSIPKPVKMPPVTRESVRSWEGGTITALDDGRMPIKGLVSSNNMILEQDSVLRPRPGLSRYVPDEPGQRLGQLVAFTQSLDNVVTNWLGAMYAVDGEDYANVYVWKNGLSDWVKIAGKDYDKAAKTRFVQLRGKLAVLNGVDTLSYLNINQLTITITSFNKLSDPAAAPTGTPTGLTGTTFKVYYAITANSTVGETAGSPVLSQSIGTDRIVWNSDTQNVKLSWGAVAGAQSYNVYMGVSADGAGQPTLYLISGGVDAQTRSFTDNGTYGQDLTRPLPTKNSTDGPRAAFGAVVSSRLWLLGDSDNPYYVWRGGDYNYEFDFSPSNGGGYTPIGAGSKEIPNFVGQFRDGKGTPGVQVRSKGSGGRGKTYIGGQQTLSYGNASIVVWVFTEDTGVDGTDSPDGVIVYNNNQYYPSRDGFKSTGTLPQLQNVLSTARLTSTIQPNVERLNVSAMEKIVGEAYGGRLYWTVPDGAKENNRVWVLDLDRKGAWMFWTMAAQWITTYDDNTGKTHLLFACSDGIHELTRNTPTVDIGKAFTTSAQSGHHRFSEDGREWARLIQVVFTPLRAQGGVNFTITAETEDGTQVFSESEEFVSGASGSGLAEWDRGLAGTLAFDDFGSVSVVDKTSAKDVIVEVDEDVKWWSWGVSSTTPMTDYALADVVSEFVKIGIKDLS